jgi:hypothetical protein
MTKALNLDLKKFQARAFDRAEWAVQADAEAAGRVLLAMMKHANATTPRELLQKAGMEPNRFWEQNETKTALLH